MDAMLYIQAVTEGQIFVSKPVKGFSGERGRAVSAGADLKVGPYM